MNTISSLLAIMPFPDIDPVLVQIGPLAVHWYGIAYVAGIMLGWFYARSLVRNSGLWHNNQPPATELQIDDFLLWAALGIVAGGRIGYILFYDFPNVVANPLRALEIWNGGMSFHGGLIGTVVAMLVYARRNGIAIWSLFDIVAAVVPIGLFFGRVANFINGELWGGLTNAPWGTVFCNTYLMAQNGCAAGDQPRHPSQLYEAILEGVVLLLALRFLTHRRFALKTPGLVSGVFVCLYALSRIFVEFFREPDAQIGYLAGGWLTMGMVLSLPMLGLGVWAILRARAARPQPA
ncbi:prolipoprotein diacylglyceryl transferase [Pararhizobium sp.]|uniref:prolipoprotein diacylglyceryl transferase n=1 Tax=Pararhizobium sp. TaxID=1977563 RepID=UPI0027273A2A|nr:prolipoprotein diacylglyceryl transferase [Pararhizobium sp.]MDO9414785.1 prolipoprotein diacylglyceryl transferase [Pararhizobium sp.]